DLEVVVSAVPEHLRASRTEVRERREVLLRGGGGRSVHVDGGHDFSCWMLVVRGWVVRGWVVAIRSCASGWSTREVRPGAPRRIARRPCRRRTRRATARRMYRCASRARRARSQPG